MIILAVLKTNPCNYFVIVNSLDFKWMVQTMNVAVSTSRKFAILTRAIILQYEAIYPKVPRFIGK